MKILLFFAISTLASAGDVLENWGQWRGPLATGEAPKATPPLKWSETENVLWKSPIPGKGHSTPIVWDDQVIVTAAIPTGESMPPKYSGRPGAHNNLPVTHNQQFVVIALDRKNGKEKWRNTLSETLPHEGGHETGSLASASPATDGKHLIVFFGSHGLYGLDLAGKLLWKKDLGQMHTKHGHGEGSAPLLKNGVVIVNWDHEEQSRIFAFDAASGKEIWSEARDEKTSWATPIAVDYKGTTQVIVSGTNRIRAYELRTGKVIWECGGLSANVVASPVYANGIVVAGSSYEKRAMFGIKLEDAKGDITGSKNVVWSKFSRTPYVPSPLLVNEHVYFLAHYQNVLSRVDIKTGKEADGPFRLFGIRNIYASPVSAAGHIYVTDLTGATLVLTDAETPKPLSRNKLEESVSASIALAGKMLFIRGEKHLYGIKKAK